MGLYKWAADQASEWSLCDCLVSVCVIEMMYCLIEEYFIIALSDSKVYGANMGPIWGQQDPGGSHVVPMNLVNWDGLYFKHT